MNMSIIDLWSLHPSNFYEGHIYMNMSIIDL